MVPSRRNALAGVLVLVSLAAGCAAKPSGFNQRFIRPGEPAIDFGPPVVAQPTGSLETYMRQVRRAADRARPVPSGTFAAGIEATDPDLAAALLALAVQPGAEAHRQVAAEYRRLRILDAAFDHLTRALQLEPWNAAAWDARARIWRDWGRLDLALPDAHRAVYYAPVSAEARNTHATVLQALGKRREARRAYEQALRFDPSAAYALNNLCYLSFLEGHSEQAVRHCEAALAIEPGLTAARNNLALAYAVGGQMDQARRELLAASPGAQAWFNIGILQMAGRKYGKAAESFDAALVLQPWFRLAADRAQQARRLAAAAEAD